MRRVCRNANRFARSSLLQLWQSSHSGANRQSKFIVNRFRCDVTAREKSRGRFGVRFQLRPALFFAVSY